MTKFWGGCSPPSHPVLRQWFLGNYINKGIAKHIRKPYDNTMYVLTSIVIIFSLGSLVKIGLIAKAKTQVSFVSCICKKALNRSMHRIHFMHFYRRGARRVSAYLVFILAHDHNAQPPILVPTMHTYNVYRSYILLHTSLHTHIHTYTCMQTYCIVYLVPLL